MLAAVFKQHLKSTTHGRELALRQSRIVLYLPCSLNWGSSGEAEKWVTLTSPRRAKLAGEGGGERVRFMQVMEEEEGQKQWDFSVLSFVRLLLPEMQT